MNKKNQNELSDFIKFAYKHNKVLDVSKAFEEYPVEEEWHEGKIENLLNEVPESYNLYSIGDIVFVKDYKYQNKQNGHNHLFVIIEQNNLAVPIENLSLLISSNLNKLKFPPNKLLKKDEQNGLNKDSIVKTDVIYMIRNDQIDFKIGSVDIENIEEYKKFVVDSVLNN